MANNPRTVAAPCDPDAQVTWDLSSSGSDLVPNGLDTIGGLIFTLNQRGVFAVTADPNVKSAVKSEVLANIAAQDIKSAPYTLTLDKNRLMTDEIGWSKAWMNANLTGLGGRRSVSLTWTPVAGASAYNVYRSAVSGGPYTKIAS